MISRKIQRKYNKAVTAVEEGDYRLAVALLKQVIERSLKKSRYYEYAFQSFVSLGDIYADAGRQTDSELLYQMAAGIDYKASFILLQQELPHYTAPDTGSKDEWLAANMIDVTDIIKSVDEKHWVYLTKKAKYRSANMRIRNTVSARKNDLAA